MSDLASQMLAISLPLMIRNLQHSIESFRVGTGDLPGTILDRYFLGGLNRVHTETSLVSPRRRADLVSGRSSWGRRRQCPSATRDEAVAEKRLAVGVRVERHFSPVDGYNILCE